MANGHPWRHAEQGNRKQTADAPGRKSGDQVRVKRYGKSAPRLLQGQTGKVTSTRSNSK